MKVAKERKSSVLASNAVHHRIDSLTSIVALFTIGGSYVFQDATWLDPVGGLLISLMVIRAGWGNTMTSLLELADTTVDDDIKSSVHKAAAKALQEIADGDGVVVRDVQGMKSGQNYLMDIELAVPGDWSIMRARLVEEAVRKAVGAKVRGVKRVKMRFIPVEQQNLTFSEEFIVPSARASPEPSENGSAEASGTHLHNHVEENGTRKRN
jgi:divalent metal cation (Fe/Co/Zn/Cd) transporter